MLPQGADSMKRHYKQELVHKEMIDTDLQTSWGVPQTAVLKCGISSYKSLILCCNLKYEKIK